MTDTTKLREHCSKLQWTGNAYFFLRTLLHDEVYARKALSLLKAEYFRDRVEKAVFEVIFWHWRKYGSVPKAEVSAFDLSKRDCHTSVGLTDDEFEQAKKKLLLLMENTKPVSHQWLLDETEDFCRFEAVRGVLFKAVDMVKDKMNPALIARLFDEAAAVGFSPEHT